MKTYELLALTALLALAGCATTSGPEGSQARVDTGERQAAVAKPGLPAVIPQGPLSAIQPSELSSQSVASLEPLVVSEWITPARAPNAMEDC